MGKRKTPSQSNKKSSNQKNQIAKAVQYQYNGPIPPPNMLQHYSDIMYKMGRKDHGE